MAPDDIIHNANFDMGCMLLAIMAGGMLLLHVLHNKDPDLNRIAWTMLSSTLSTLVAVLVSGTWKNMVTWIVDAETATQILTLDLALYVGWYLFMQMSYLILLGTSKGCSFDHFKWRLQFCAPSLSILVGASSMPFWAIIQNWTVAHFEGNTAICVAYASILIAAVIMVSILRTCHHLREAYLASDGIVDEKEECLDLCIIEAENKVVAMVLSHLLVQAVRLQLMGQMPPPDGSLNPGQEATHEDAESLWLASCIFLSVIVCGHVLANCFHDFTDGVIIRRRNIAIGKQTMQNAITWCWLYGGIWWVQDWLGVDVVGAILHAFIVTSLGAFMIYLLDKLRDLECTGPLLDDEIKDLIPSATLWIGWSWKRAFAQSLEKSASKFTALPQPIVLFVMTAMLVAIILPGWGWYVLPIVMKGGLQQHKHDLDHRKSFLDENEPRTGIEQKMGGNSLVSGQKKQDAEKGEPNKPDANQGSPTRQGVPARQNMAAPLPRLELLAPAGYRALPEGPGEASRPKLPTQQCRELQDRLRYIRQMMNVVQEAGEAAQSMEHGHLKCLS